MSETPHQSSHFSMQGDGRYHGDDRFGGELAGMTLYVVRALTQIDGFLGMGELSRLTVRGGEQDLEVRVDFDGDFGVQVKGTLTSTGNHHARPAERATATLGDEMKYVLDSVTEVPLVSGAFLVGAAGGVVADKVPGLPEDAIAGTGRRMKVAHDAFDRLLGATTLATTFEWGRLASAPVGDGIVVAIVDLECDVPAFMQAAHLSGAVLTGVDLSALAKSATV